MNILITENPGKNSYIQELINEYNKAGHTVICNVNNFFTSNFEPDLLHIHWPERLYKWYDLSKTNFEDQLTLIEERFKWYKSKKTTIVHTIHNVLPHNSINNEKDTKVYNLVIRYADLLIHHCKKSIDIISTQFPNVKFKNNVIAFHGDYLTDYGLLSKTDARKKLNLPLEKFIILNFGSQQPYKGLNFVESVFRSLGVQNKFLLTAGNYRSINKSGLIKIYDQIKIRFKNELKYGSKQYYYCSIPNEDIKYFFHSSDIIFLGHQVGLNSGLLNLAATFSKPVVMPNIGCFEEQMKNWEYEVYEAGNHESARNAINTIHNRIINSKIDYDNSLWLNKNSWENHVKIILKSIKS